jgi:hypothetical protein
LKTRNKEVPALSEVTSRRLAASAGTIPDGGKKKGQVAENTALVEREESSIAS